jgi:hypothetical protein
VSKIDSEDENLTKNDLPNGQGTGSAQERVPGTGNLDVSTESEVLKSLKDHGATKEKMLGRVRPFRLRGVLAEEAGGVPVHMGFPRNPTKVQAPASRPTVVDQEEEPDADVVGEVSGEFGVVSDKGEGRGPVEAVAFTEFLANFVQKEFPPDKTAPHDLLVEGGSGHLDITRRVPSAEMVEGISTLLSDVHKDLFRGNLGGETLEIFGEHRIVTSAKVVKGVPKPKQLGRALEVKFANKALGDIDLGPILDHVKGKPVHDVEPIEVAEDGDSETIKVKYPANKGGVAGRGEESAHAAFEFGQSVFVDVDDVEFKPKLNTKVGRTERDLDAIPRGGGNNITDVGVVLDSWEDVGLLEIKVETRGTGEGVQSFGDFDEGPGVGEEAARVVSKTPNIHIVNPREFEQENVSTDVEEEGREGATLLDTPLDQDAKGNSTPEGEGGRDTFK